MTLQLTYEDALATLTEIVQEVGPDYVYQDQDQTGSCFYVKDDRPSCIIGRLLHRKGVPLEDFRLVEGKSVFALVGMLFLCDRKTKSFLTAVQEKQDRDIPWGRALQESIEEIEARYP